MRQEKKTSCWRCPRLYKTCISNLFASRGRAVGRSDWRRRGSRTGRRPRPRRAGTAASRRTRGPRPDTGHRGRRL